MKINKPHSEKLDLIFQMVRNFICQNAVKANRVFCSLRRDQRKLNIALIPRQNNLDLRLCSLAKVLITKMSVFQM